MPISNALITCGMVGAQPLAAFIHEGLVNVADFAELRDEDVIKMCEAMAARRVNQHGCPIGL